MALSPGAMMKAIVQNLPQRTGRSLPEWIQLVRDHGPETRQERVRWLKAEHRLGHIQAEIVADQVDGATLVYDDPGKLVDDLFAGAKAALRPVYEEVAAAALRINGVRVSPCKTYVGFTRKYQFATARPTGKLALDLRLALDRGLNATGRLALIKADSSRMTHAVQLAAPADVDAEVRDWLRAAAGRAA